MTTVAERMSKKSEQYQENEARLFDHFKNTSVPDQEVLENLFLFVTPQQMRRALFLYELYKDIQTVPGVIMQFGVRWGRELAFFEALRTTFEPFNHSRRIIGFDTFEGYAGVHEKDGNAAQIKPGNLTVAAGYEKELESILDAREQLAPLDHVRKFDLVKGDVAETLPAWLEENPQTVVALAHLDLNLYQPTKTCLELLRPHMPKGAVVIIDEVNLKSLPGETAALKEVFGLENLRLRRLPHVNPTWPAYFVVE